MYDYTCFRAYFCINDVFFNALMIGYNCKDKENKIMNKKVSRVEVTDNIAVGGGAPLLLIAGPCVIESEAHAFNMAQMLKELAAEMGIQYVFKASYDKANRSSLDNFRGPGITDGLAVLQAIKEELALPVLTDFHAEAEIAAVSEVADIIQIPAFLSRQTDILVSAGKSGRVVNIKKGQFMAPWDMKNAVNKVLSSGNKKVCITERGASFGYNNLVSDFRGLPIMREFAPVIFDATHSAQLPGGLGGCSGGDREMASVLARSAAAAGVDGIFLEVHDNPDQALCDGPNMIRFSELEKLLKQILAIRAALLV